jgi:galactofuranose transport system ATP-binding protein
MVGNIPILEIKGLCKSFSGVEALANVDFTLRKGEVHALVGENGAGKSTLIKVLTGLYEKDGGEIYLEKKSFECHSPTEATKHGISTVYQEINLIPTLSVAENIFLGRQPVSFGKIQWKKIKKGAEAALKRLDLEIDVTELLSSYPIAIQQMVAIARAIDISAKVLILDEPTSSLDTHEVKQLFSVMRKLKGKGIAIIFITHFLEQVYEISDRITVLRNGDFIGEYETAKLSRVQLITSMLGKEFKEIDFKKITSAGAYAGAGKNNGKHHAFYKLEGVKKQGKIDIFDLDIFKGEVLGFAGLLGSGRTEIARILFGIEKPDRGNQFLYGKRVKISSPGKAIKNRFGFCPENRKEEGIFPNLTVRENIIISIQARLGIFNYLSRKKQEELIEKYMMLLRIKTPSYEQTVCNLSGGNQQKVIVARWLASEPVFLILDEPTKGIDIGAKAEIQKIIISLSKEGMAILFISSELEEVVRCSNRVIVLRDRKKIRELSGEQIKEKIIMHTIANGGIKDDD